MQQITSRCFALKCDTGNWDFEHSDRINCTVRSMRAQEYEACKRCPQLLLISPSGDVCLKTIFVIQDITEHFPAFAGSPCYTIHGAGPVRSTDPHGDGDDRIVKISWIPMNESRWTL